MYNFKLLLLTKFSNYIPLTINKASTNKILSVFPFYRWMEVSLIGVYVIFYPKLMQFPSHYYRLLIVTLFLFDY